MAIISYDAYVCCLKGGENKEIRSAERTPKHNKKKNCCIMGAWLEVQYN